MKTTWTLLFLAISSVLYAQVERPRWEFGGGVRFNYMGLSGGFSGFRNSDGVTFDIKYKDIGMDKYSPSFAIALGGRFKKWNLEFGGSRGSYGGSFTTPSDMVRDDRKIDSGSVVNGSIDMTMLVLTTSFSLIQKKHDLGVGLGILVLNMGSNYTTLAVTGEEIKLGGDQWFPMPFLAINGRLKFGRFRINGSGGGSIFIGNMDGYNYNLKYVTFDGNAAYDFLKTNRLSLSFDLGYRLLFMDLNVDNDLGWYKEKDFYQGPYATIRMKLFGRELWKPAGKKEKKR
jgi:hypothetical protein